MSINNTLCAITFAFACAAYGANETYNYITEEYQPDVWQSAHHPKYNTPTARNIYNGKLAHPLAVAFPLDIYGNETKFTWSANFIGDIPSDERGAKPWKCTYGDVGMPKLFNSITNEVAPTAEMFLLNNPISNEIFCFMNHEKYGKISVLAR